MSDKARITRQKLRSERKRKSEPGKTTYFPGAFGLSATPDIDLGDKCPSKKTKSKNRMVKSSKPTTPPNAPNSVAVPTLNAPQIQKDELMTIDFSTTPVQIKFVPDDDIEHVIILK